ncbi:MAG TPA: DUF3592 domain-containing protein [Planctomycetota bacterium]|nr:DUF3592 domain-containing protein [Planctomycetota bacterium]
MPDKKLLPVVGGLAFLWCMFMVMYTVRVYIPVRRQQQAQEHFTVTSGVVDSASVGSAVVRERDNGRDYQVTYYYPRIAYHYDVGKRTVASTRHTYDESRFSDSTYASRIIAEYPAGKKVAVYYDPENPSDSVLELGLPPTMTWRLLCIRPFWAAGITLVLLTAHLVLLARRIRRYDPIAERIPCSIPGWGTLHRSERGFVIIRRPRLLLSMASVFFLTTFLTIFVLWALGMTFSSKAHQIARYSCGALSLMAGAVVLWKDGSRLSVDHSRRVVAIRRAFRTQEMSLDEVATVCVGWLKARSKALSLYLRSGAGRTLRLHVFDLGEDTTAITRRAAQQIARILGKPVEAESAIVQSGS